MMLCRAAYKARTQLSMNPFIMASGAINSCVEIDHLGVTTTFLSTAIEGDIFSACKLEFGRRGWHSIATAFASEFRPGHPLPRNELHRRGVGF